MVVAFEYKADRFKVPVGTCKFKTQFVDLYKTRIECLKPSLIKAITNFKEYSDLKIVTLTDLPKDKRSLIAGILYKEAPLKRNILKELAAEEKMEHINETQLKVDRFISAEDHVYIEDEVQRICLKFFDPKTINSLVTGIYCGVIGLESDADPGYFIVEKLVFPGESGLNYIPRKIEQSSNLIGFVSGLCFPGQSVSSESSHLSALNLLGDWIRTCSDLRKLYICGNLIRISDSSLNLPRFISRKSEAPSLSAMRLFDEWLAGLPLGSNDGISVEILPGPNDCVGSMLPQQPFHSCCLPKSVLRSGRDANALRSVTNPMMCEVLQRRLLVTSGQNINDIMRYSDFSDPLDVMEATLKWSHLAPTCPDTLYGYPLNDLDRLALGEADKDWPDIYVAGNLAHLTEPHYRRLKSLDKDDGSLVIAMPEFSISPVLVIVNVTDLSVRLVKFK